MGSRDDFFEKLAQQHWAVADDLIDPTLHERLDLESQHAWKMGLFHEASIGRLHSAALSTGIRGDAICWLTSNDPRSASADFLAWADTMRQDMNQLFYAGLNSDEFHFARYAEGRGYKKHLDQHQRTPHRRISLVLYLNRQWADTDGGELCLYSPDDSQVEIKRILPQPGRLVMFRSDLIHHEVLPCAQPRRSLTGWFRTDRPLI